MGSLLLIHLPPSRWWRRARWRLYKPLDIATYRVPRGFVTDGISAPWLMAWLISPTGRGFPAAVLHDYLLSLLVGQQSRHDADEAFYQALQQCGVAEWRARGMYLAVRLFALLKGAY